MTEELEKKRQKVTDAAHALRLARQLYEDEAKRQTELKLEPLVTAFAEAVREAFDADDRRNKSALGRAMLTKDRGTVDRVLEMTEDSTPVIDLPDWGTAPVEVAEELKPNMRFNYDPTTGILKVRDGSDEAEFTVDYWEGGEIYLFSQTNLWDKGYANRNDIVFLLDGKNLVEKENKLAAELLPYIRGIL